MAAAFGSSGGDQRQHPSGLPYVNVENPTDEERDVLGKQLKKTGSNDRKAFLFASPVHKKGKLTTHKRGFYIGPTAVYVKDEHLKRCVPILELGEMYVDRAWMGLSCPTQYGMLMQFPSEEKARQAKKVLTTLHEYLQRNRRRPRELRVTDPLPAGGNMLNHVRVSKPSDWGLEQIESVPVPTQAAVAAQHEEEGLPKHADAGTSAAPGASPARSSGTRAAAAQLTLQVVSREEYCGDEEEEVSELDDLELAETEQMQQTRAQMEAEVEAAMLGAQEWERKAGTLKVREAQLERTLRDAKSELEDMAARSAQLSSDLSTAESQGAELRMENEFLKKQQVAACEGLGIVPDGDVSLTEAARRLQAVHDSLTDDNWRLTKEIATLEKRHNELLSESRLGQDRVKLEADAEALRALIEVRATDSHTHERTRTDGKNITALTKQLHAERQAHEETKLQLFELTQKHSSLENRFKEHTSTSKQAQRALEKKLKQALQQYQALEEHLGGSEGGAAAGGALGVDKSFMYTSTGFEKKPRFVTGPGGGGGGGSRARSVSQSSVFPSPGRMDGDAAPCNVVYHHSHAHDGPDRAEETELVVGQKVVLNRSGAANKENCGTPAGSGNVATSGKGSGAEGEPVPCRGVVRYIGRLAGHTGEWVGVELDEKTPGGHSGSLHGKVYFECKAGRGLFIRPSLVAVEGFACRRCASKHLKRTGSSLSEQVFVPPPPPHHRARSRSPSMSMQRSMSLQVAPPPYNAAGVAAAAATTAAAAATASSDEYLQLAIQLKEKLEEAEKRQQHAEAARSPSPKLHPSPASPPPDYSALNTSITSAVSTGGAGAPFTSRRGKSRDRSVSPSIRGPEKMQHESAMREALSSCVKQLSSKGGLPRADHSMTSADILWARRKSSQEEQY